MTRLSSPYRFQGSRAIARQFPGVRVTPAVRTWDTVARDTFAMIPSWILLGMVLLAAAGICLTVNLRGRAQLLSAETQFRQLSGEVNTMRKSNSELQLEVRRITTEPALIESAARTRLGMVKPTEIVVPIQPGVSTNLTLSFVR